MKLKELVKILTELDQAGFDNLPVLSLTKGEINKVEMNMDDEENEEPSHIELS